MTRTSLIDCKLLMRSDYAMEEMSEMDGGDEQDEYMRWDRWIYAWSELNGFVRELVDGFFNIRIECLRSLKSLR